MFPSMGNWYAVSDGDPRARALFKRHYSYIPYQDNRERIARTRKFVGPGEVMVLITLNCDALFVWRKFIDDSGQEGINCAVFRNESDILSSELILEAEKLAQNRWPGERMYTYVNPEKVASSNPGYCFIKAGWNKCGITQKRNYLIFEKTL